ncbi:FAD-binding oxidoreductase [Furfurilactobacillus entadae]|uniref:FAD-binding oxidoreductase n=1 Tax=Furfurilactobacillus entadae TaxID=2922307 RepID=UPI0035EAAAD9
MLKKVPYLNGLVWLVILFVIPLPLIQTLALGLPTIYSSEALAIQFGSIAYVWFLAAIYLSTRPRWLDRLIGLPSVYFIHGMLSMFAIGLAYLHKTETSSGGLIKQTGDWAFDLFLGLMLYSLIFMAGWLTSRIPLLDQLKHRLEVIFHHELSVWLHRLNLIAVALVFLHVQLISYVTSITSFMIFFDGYTILVLAAYLIHKATHVWGLPAATLVDKRELAPNFFEFRLQLRRPDQVTIKPGDYVFVNFPNVDHLKELHPFSVVNAVTETGEIVLAIRGDGDFSRLVQSLPLGAKAAVEGGFGRFAAVLKEQNNRLTTWCSLLAVLALFPCCRSSRPIPIKKSRCITQHTQSKS